MKNINQVNSPAAGNAIFDQREMDEISITCYNKEVPFFVEAALENLYENIYSTIPQWRLSGTIKDASTYVLKKNCKIVSIIIFQLKNNQVTVINEVIAISHEDAYRFAQYIFSTFCSASVISFQAIQTDVKRLPFPYQRVNYSENIVVSLPLAEADYLASLGGATRKNLIRHRNRIKRDFPSFSHRIYEREKIDEEHIRAIVKFNWRRMASKDKVSDIGERETQRLITLAKSHGFILAITIDGNICAGAICFNVGTNYFMEICSHDSSYDDYRLGTLCCFLCICETIARSGSELHLLWGQYKYKYMLRGIQRDLDNLVIYRNRMHLLLNVDIALKTATQGCIRRMKLWLHSPENQKKIIVRFIRSAIDFVRARRKEILGYCNFGAAAN